MNKRTKWVSISTKTKHIVNERDESRCVTCGKYCDWNLSNSHYIKRSAGGSGGERNIVTQCPCCHHLTDFGTKKQMDDMHSKMEWHLKSCYPDWDKKSLIYDKWRGYEIDS